MYSYSSIEDRNAAIIALGKALKDDDPKVRVAVASVLGERFYDHPAVETFLIPALKDEDANVRSNATHGLRNYLFFELDKGLASRDTILKPYRELFRDPNPQVRYQMVVLFGFNFTTLLRDHTSASYPWTHLAPEIFPELVNLLGDPNEEIRILTRGQIAMMIKHTSPNPLGMIQWAAKDGSNPIKQAEAQWVLDHWEEMGYHPPSSEETPPSPDTEVGIAPENLTEKDIGNLLDRLSLGKGSEADKQKITQWLQERIASGDPSQIQLALRFLARNSDYFFYGPSKVEGLLEASSIPFLLDYYLSLPSNSDEQFKVKEFLVTDDYFKDSKKQHFQGLSDQINTDLRQGHFTPRQTLDATDLLTEIMKQNGSDQETINQIKHQTAVEIIDKWGPYSLDANTKEDIITFLDPKAPETADIIDALTHYTDLGQKKSPLPTEPEGPSPLLD